MVEQEQQSSLIEKRVLGSTSFEATVLGIGDLADRSTPLEQCVTTIHRAMHPLFRKAESPTEKIMSGVPNVFFYSVSSVSSC